MTTCDDKRTLLGRLQTVVVFLGSAAVVPASVDGVAVAMGLPAEVAALVALCWASFPSHCLPIPRLLQHHQRRLQSAGWQHLRRTLYAGGVSTKSKTKETLMLLLLSNAHTMPSILSRIRGEQE